MWAQAQQYPSRSHHHQISDSSPTGWSQALTTTSDREGPKSNFIKRASERRLSNGIVSMATSSTSLISSEMEELNSSSHNNHRRGSVSSSHRHHEPSVADYSRPSTDGTVIRANNTRAATGNNGEMGSPTTQMCRGTSDGIEGLQVNKKQKSKKGKKKKKKKNTNSDKNGENSMTDFAQHSINNFDDSANLFQTSHPTTGLNQNGSISDFPPYESDKHHDNYQPPPTTADMAAASESLLSDGNHGAFQRSKSSIDAETTPRPKPPKRPGVFHESFPIFQNWSNNDNTAASNNGTQEREHQPQQQAKGMAYDQLDEADVTPSFFQNDHHDTSFRHKNLEKNRSISNFSHGDSTISDITFEQHDCSKSDSLKFFDLLEKSRTLQPLDDIDSRDTSQQEAGQSSSSPSELPRSSMAATAKARDGLVAMTRETPTQSAWEDTKSGEDVKWEQLTMRQPSHKEPTKKASITELLSMRKNTSDWGEIEGNGNSQGGGDRIVTHADLKAEKQWNEEERTNNRRRSTWAEENQWSGDEVNNKSDTTGEWGRDILDKSNIQSEKGAEWPVQPGNFSDNIGGPEAGQQIVNNIQHTTIVPKSTTPPPNLQTRPSGESNWAAFSQLSSTNGASRSNPTLPHFQGTSGDGTTRIHSATVASRESGVTDQSAPSSSVSGSTATSSKPSEKSRKLLVQYLTSLGKHPEEAQAVVDSFLKQKSAPKMDISKSFSSLPVNQQYDQGSVAQQSVKTAPIPKVTSFSDVRITPQSTTTTDYPIHEDSTTSRKSRRRFRRAPGSVASDDENSTVVTASSRISRKRFGAKKFQRLGEEDGYDEDVMSIYTGVTGASGKYSREPNDAKSYDDEENQDNHDTRSIGSIKGFLGPLNAFLEFINSDTMKTAFPIGCIATFVMVLILLIMVQGPVVAEPTASETDDDDGNFGASAKPTSPPTKINDGFLNRAIELSGESALDDLESPQRRAVAWLSTFDSKDTADYTFTDQRYVMSVLYFSLNGELWTSGYDWLNTTKHECSWSPYVVCGGDTKDKVINIDFTDSGLSGSIPREIGFLSNLEILYLANNEIEGSLPSSLFSLSHMSILDVQNNNIEGWLPRNLGTNMKGLKFLDLSNNKLSGDIPESLWSLSELRSVKLFRNGLSGTISSSLKNMLALENLALKGNQLTGTIPVLSLYDAPSIDTIKLGCNRLEGTIPFWILAGRNRNVELDENNLEGLPELPGSYNTTDDFLGSSLEELDLRRNSLHSSVPIWLGQLPNLQKLQLNKNQLTGPLPFVSGNLWPKLKVFKASYNRLSGVLPDTSLPPNLGYLNVSHNEFFGSGIPTSLSRLKIVDISFNTLRGSMTDFVMGFNRSNCRLAEFHAASCSMTGSIPFKIIKLAPTLQELNLANNSLTNTLPVEFTSLSHLEMLNLSSNRFEGPLPSDIGDLSMLTTLDLSNNQFRGTLPESFASLLSLQSFNLSDNNFEGEVSLAMCDIMGGYIPLESIGCELQCLCCKMTGHVDLCSADNIFDNP